MLKTFSLALVAFSSVTAQQMTIDAKLDPMTSDMTAPPEKHIDSSTAQEGDGDDDNHAVTTIDLDKIGEAFESQLKKEGIPMKAGDHMRFKVGGNPTTGYQWNINEDVINGAFAFKKSFKRSPAPEFYVGVGGTYYFDITAGDSGSKGTFEIAYYRPWESANRAFNKYSIPINVM